MNMKNGKMELALGSWLAAFAIATIAGVMLWVLGGWGFLQGAFVGFLVFIIVGLLLSWMMTRPLPGPNELNLTTPPAISAKTARVPRNQRRRNPPLQHRQHQPPHRVIGLQ